MRSLSWRHMHMAGVLAIRMTVLQYYSRHPHNPYSGDFLECHTLSIPSPGAVTEGYGL